MEMVFYFHPSYLHIFHFPLHLLNEALLLSYLYGDLDYAQRLVDKHSGKGPPLLDKNGNWLRKEKFTDIDNEIFEGIVSDYIYPEDNEPEGVAGICIEDCPQRPGDWIGFNEHDIKEIKITD